jgi:hypothetical protein
MEQTTREESPQSTKAAMKKRLQHQILQLSSDIRVAIEEEERLLLRLKSSRRIDAWAALRNNNSFLSPLRSMQDDNSQRHGGQAFDRGMRRPVVHIPESVEPSGVTAPLNFLHDERPIEQEKRRENITFVEYTDMDSSSKRARIRRGLLLQQDKIRAILGRLQQRSATALEESSTGSTDSI